MKKNFDMDFVHGGYLPSHKIDDCKNVNKYNKIKCTKCEQYDYVPHNNNTSGLNSAAAIVYDNVSCEGTYYCVMCIEDVIHG